MTIVKIFDKMATKRKIKSADQKAVNQIEAIPEISKGGLVGASTQKPKSKTRLFWEKYPEGIGSIVDMRAVLK